MSTQLDIFAQAPAERPVAPAITYGASAAAAASSTSTSLATRSAAGAATCRTRA